jgi:hypothetical protein
LLFASSAPWDVLPSSVRRYVVTNSLSCHLLQSKKWMVKGDGDECEVNNAEFVITGSCDILLWIAEFAQVNKR